MSFRFTKMQALGNDFVVIDAVNQSIDLSVAQRRLLADRHRGIGFDQLLLLEPAQSLGVDFRYRIFNADGGEVAQCGNGARCLARFILESGLSAKAEFVVETLQGRLRLRQQAANSFSASLGVPRFAPAEIPHQLAGQGPSYPLSVAGQELVLWLVNVGNPHAVIQINPQQPVDVEQVSRALATHPGFPEGVNVGFLSLVSADPAEIHLRVYERGAGQTQACGSGACAAAVIALTQGWCQGPVTVKQPGGELRVEWGGDATEVWLSGPAESVFEGFWLASE